MDSLMTIDHGPIFSSVQINGENPMETNSLLLRSSSSNSENRNNVQPATTMTEKTQTHQVIEYLPSYSIEEITSRRRGKRAEDEKLPKKVRSFYKKQDKLISTLERVHRFHSQKDSDIDDEDEHAEDNMLNEKRPKKKDESKLRQKRISFYTKLSLFINVCLLIAKIAAAIVSESLSVISSVVDSCVDLASGVILFWATRAIKRRDPFMYPQGRTRLEPISIVILAVIMCSASLEVITKSLQTTIADTKILIRNPPNVSELVHHIDMSALPIAIMCSTIVLKLILFFLCSRETSETLNALAQDHRNDVFSNTIVLICGLLGHFGRTKPTVPVHFCLFDSIGAILISIYILASWVRQAKQQIKRLTGYTANPEFLQQITWIAFHHSPLISKIDTVRAFHFGTHFLVEVDIVLPEEMLLKEAHDIGEELQKKIERIPEVERAFVHLDYEFNHKASDEHKVV